MTYEKKLARLKSARALLGHPLERLQHHVSGAIARGEGSPVVGHPVAAVLEVKESPLEWQRKGLQQTASGYGARLTTPYMVRVGGRWWRVYSYCYSNSGTLYIGRSLKAGVIVEIWRDDSNTLRAESTPRSESNAR